jgi:SPP1 family predicted phage head-tail adaptor
MASKPRIYAGELDRRVSVQARTVTRDENTGAEVETWATVAQLWASVRDQVMGARETESLQVASLGQQTRIRLRWTSTDISPETHRILYGSRLLQIVVAAEVGRREFLDLVCLEWSHE